jgi:hypothetical protein
LVAALATSLVACGGGTTDGNGSSSVSSQPLAGMIDGQPWTFIAGQTDHFLSKPTTFFATLYDQPIPTACTPGDPPGAARSLILNIPAKVGEYPMSLAFNQTFVYSTGVNNGFQNDIATTGLLEVTSLTTTTVQGGVKMALGTNDSVDGQFEISICAQ